MSDDFLNPNLKQRTELNGYRWQKCVRKMYGRYSAKSTQRKRVIEDTCVIGAKAKRFTGREAPRDNREQMGIPARLVVVGDGL